MSHNVSEYAKSDSRYLTLDATVWGVEAFTAALWGPFSFASAYWMLRGDAKQYLTQFAVSFGQAYGCVLYYLTSGFEGFPHSRPEPLYFWGYFIGLNAFWMIIPSYVMVRNAKLITAALNSSASAKKTTDSHLHAKEE